MMSYIKSQAVSDEAEPAISTMFIIGVSLVAAIWLFSRLFAATERKGADVSNCIAGSTTLGVGGGTATQNQCHDDQSNGHSYNYGQSLS